MDDYIKKVGQSIDDAIDFFLKRINEFTLRKDNIPAKISYINGGQEEIFIVW